MISVNFPEIFDKNKIQSNVAIDYKATLQNIELLLLSSKGELFGDPYFGSNLRRFLFEQNDVILRDLLIDDIYTALALFIPQITVKRKDIIIKEEKGKLVCSLMAKNKADFKTNLYNIVLLDTRA